MFHINSGPRFSPCIISKVKHALGVPNRYNFNNKRCSLQYWKKVCQFVGALNDKTQKEINTAFTKFENYMYK